ncbi:hypothetical protein GRI89_14355 [Altererythrobacter salegens]|uniref:Nucleotidyl transferase domain-containing protein n=1 Tax=Croceibacterium salegens TaxID=1737568 RepID=A0A6I4SXK3_9SPHN|nr:hypothetical protein [Croceibacterium salegens]MXO60721.1 hypothetical protein [Croceibacterium salegens]
MKVIVPCAGKSSRFPDMPPKWMLPDHDGLPMVRKAIEGLNVPAEDLIFTILREHEAEFGAIAGLHRAFGPNIKCIVLEMPTRSQSETVAETLKQAEIQEPFLVKDSDNYFSLDWIEDDLNYVSVASLNDFDHINARNKSYVQVDQEGLIRNIREKNVISDLFSVGGYYFVDPDEFLSCFEELSSVGNEAISEIYLSEIIGSMILRGHAFKTKKALNYRDWGTINEWREELERRRLYLVAVDGFVFERGSSFFSPLFHEVKSNPQAIEVIKKMNSLGQSIIYLSVRPGELEDMTKQQIRELGLPDAPIVFNCGVAPWALLTSPHATLPFITSRSAELDPNDFNLLDKLELRS